ncbi:MAG: DUF4340 domain-containing protein [Anaerolineae bacterium]|nr:DUF4340 domain-containing protein [Anaerolineae bacterium]
MKRHQQILLGVLIVQVILSAIVFWPRQVASGTGEPLFPDLTAEDIVALTIADNTGGEITLRKEGDAWVFPESDGYPATASSITPVLEKLAFLSSNTIVARTEASHAQLEVADDAFQRRIDFETADGEEHTVYLGTAPRYTATHFRVAGQAETYLTTDLSAWEFTTTASTWADTSYVSIDQETLTQATLENANGTFVLVRDGDNWALADMDDDEEAQITNTNAIVRNASNITMQRPLGKEAQPSYGMDDPSAVVTLTTADGTEHVLTVGSKDEEDNSYVVKSSDSDYYVRVAAYSVSTMVERTRDDFVQPPPTPVSEGPEAPTPTPEP